MAEDIPEHTPTGYKIPFTQYIPPDRGQQAVLFDTATKESWEKAQQIIAAGFRFEVEILMDGKVSATIGDDNADWAFAIHPNAPGLDVVINKMIMDFDIDAMKAKSEAMSSG